MYLRVVCFMMRCVRFPRPPRAPRPGAPGPPGRGRNRGRGARERRGGGRRGRGRDAAPAEAEGEVGEVEGPEEEAEQDPEDGDAEDDEARAMLREMREEAEALASGEFEDDNDDNARHARLESCEDGEEDATQEGTRAAHIVRGCAAGEATDALLDRAREAATATDMLPADGLCEEVLNIAFQASLANAAAGTDTSTSADHVAEWLSSSQALDTGAAATKTLGTEASDSDTSRILKAWALGVQQAAVSCAYVSRPHCNRLTPGYLALVEFTDEAAPALPEYALSNGGGLHEEISGATRMRWLFVETT